MEQETKERLSKFIESIEEYSFELKDLEKDIENNDFNIKTLIQDINVYTSDILYEIYGLKIHTEYPDWFWLWTYSNHIFGCIGFEFEFGFELWVASNLPLIFCVSKNIKGLGLIPASRYIQNEVARIYDACQTTLLLDEI